MKKLIFCLIITSCSVSKNTDYANGYVYPLEDVKLEDEFLKELQLNLIQTGVIIKDSI